MAQQVDTSIYGRFQPTVKLQSPFEIAAGMQQIQQGRNQNRLAQMQLKEAERSDSERNALAGIARQYGNTPEYGNRLMEGGFVQQAQAQSKYQSEQAKTARDAEKAQIESHLKKFEVIGQIMGGVQDQASYDAARQQVAGVLGPEAVAKMPPTYDPALIQQKMTEAMTVKEQLEGKWKKLDYDLNTSKFAYQQGNDAANRGVTMRGQDIGANNAAAGRAVTIRGQNLVDARGRSDTAKAPSGYRFTPDGGLEPIPGGPGAARSAEVDFKREERDNTRSAKRDSIGAQIAVIDKALKHPGRKAATGLSGTLDPRNYVAGTNATDFRVVLDQIGGTAFLQAFESLKGGGQITEVEGKKATDAMARLNRAQSDSEFEVSLKDLREVMTKGRDRLERGSSQTPKETNIDSILDKYK